MVKKQRAHRKGLVKVTFSLLRAEVDTVRLMADFNEWRGEAMRRTADGEWQLTVELERGRQYQFKYLLDETVWINDPEAEQAVANPYGGENSVVAT